MKMNRRTFQSTLLLAVGAGICSMAPAANAVAPSKYWHRLRFRRQGGVYNFWMRIVNPSNMTSDVPFTLQFSTDSASQNVIYSNAHVARVASSHMVRGRIDLAAAGWKSGSPLFAKFLLGEEKTPGEVRRLVPLKFASAVPGQK
jgi:hypothetical protein